MGAEISDYEAQKLTYVHIVLLPLRFCNVLY